MLVKKPSPVLLQIVYYMPKHPTLVQEFTWGYDDHTPELIRTHKFLNYWKNHVDAVIADIFISISNGKQYQWRNVDDILKFHG
jgi:uncharacterized protein Usg